MTNAEEKKVEIIDKVKKRFNIVNELTDEILFDIYESVIQEYLLISEKKDLEDNHSWIVKEICIVRFNRLGDEGVKASSIEGLSKTYINTGGMDDFKPYMAYLKDNGVDKGATKGKVKFL